MTTNNTKKMQVNGTRIAVTSMFKSGSVYATAIEYDANSQKYQIVEYTNNDKRTRILIIETLYIATAYELLGRRIANNALVHHMDFEL